MIQLNNHQYNKSVPNIKIESKMLPEKQSNYNAPLNCYRVKSTEPFSF